MKKILVCFLSIVLLLCACSKGDSEMVLPKGVRLVENTSEVRMMEAIRPMPTIETVISSSTAVIKFRIIDIINVYFEITKNPGDSWEQPATVYKAEVIKVIDNIGNNQFQKGQEVLIYSDQSNEFFVEYAVNLQKNNEYIIFVSEYDESVPKSISDFTDVGITNLDAGVILCKDSETYLVSDFIINSFNIDFSSVTKDEANYNNEILPSQVSQWKKIESKDFEKNLSGILSER